MRARTQYSLGSDWFDVPTQAETYTIKDDLSGKTLVSKQETPPAAPLGYTNMLLGAQAGAKPIMLVPLADAPEGGVCKP